MANQRRVNWVSQQRVDLPDLRSIESAVSNDFDQLIQGLVTGTSQGYIVRGFNILMSGAITGAASNLLLKVDPGAVLHIASSQSGAVLMVPAGTASQQLNSATNTLVDGAFTPSATNYVSIEYERFIDSTTSAQVYIWNPTSNSETTKNVPRAQILRFRIKISTTTPASNYLPVAIVTTDASNNVTSITDARWMFARLGTGGLTPDPFASYSWPGGRTEKSPTSISNSDDPFAGGDKNIDTLKSWMDAVMMSIREIKGTTYWYTAGTSGSIATLQEDLGNTVITGKGSIAHGVLPSDGVTPTAAGQINWDQDIHLRVVGSALDYILSSNAATTDITLTDDKVAYVTLIRGVLVTPNLIFTNGSAVITSVGAVPWTASLLAGDFLKLSTDTDAGYYKILTVDSATQVTLTSNYLGSSTGAAGAKGKYAFGSYQTNAAPSTTRHIYTALRAAVPAGQDVFWLFMRSDNGGGNPRVYIRFLGTELDQGEDRDISDTSSEELIRYIGALSEADFDPSYSTADGGPTSNSYVTDADNLTKSIKRLDTHLFQKTAQDRTMKLVEGGNWNYLVDTLTWDATAYIRIPGIVDARNSISAGSVQFDGANDVAYVTINRSAGAPAALTVNKAQSSALTLTSDMVVIARKDSTGVLVGMHSMHLVTTETRKMDSTAPLTLDTINNKTTSTGDFVAKLTVQTQELVDSTTTGATAQLNAITNSYIKVTNAGLTGLQMIPAGVDGQTLKITNKTGAQITVYNEAGATPANQIVTGTAGNLLLNNDATIDLIYDANSSRWRCSSVNIGGLTVSNVTPLAEKVIGMSGVSSQASRDDHIHPVQTEYDMGNSGAGLTIDWNNGKSQKVTLSVGGVGGMVTFSFTNPATGAPLKLRLIWDDFGGQRPIWIPSINWINDTAPIFSGAPNTQALLYFYYTGSAYLQITAQEYSTLGLIPNITAIGADYNPTILLNSTVLQWGPKIISTDSGYGDNSLITYRPLPNVSWVGGRSFNSISPNGGGRAIEASTGYIYAWGTNNQDFVGDNTTTARSSPVSVAGGRSFSKVAGGHYGTVGIEGSTGNAYAWGLNNYGNIGDGTRSNRSSPVFVLGGRSFKEISMQMTGGAAIEGSTCNAYTWGINTAGNLGDNTTTNRSSPVSVVGGRSFSQIAAGSPGAIAIEASTGNAYAWGSNAAGNLGDNTTTNRSSPVSVVGGRSFSKISCSNGGVAIEGSTGNAYAWGLNNYGQLGDGTTQNRSSPTSVLGGRSFSLIAAGQTYTLAVEGSTGNLYGWGDPQYLGSPYGQSFNYPYPVKSKYYGNRSFSSIVCSLDYSVTSAIEASTGNAYAWGSNAAGNLGDNTTTNRSSPVSVVGGRSFSQMAMGTNTVYAIEGSTGNAYAWGDGLNGKLGTNSTTSTSSPVSVVGGRIFSQIAGGGSTEYAIEGSTGNAYAWGVGLNGLLGNNATANASSPVSVVGGRGFSQIVGGTDSNALAIEASTGNAYAWGSNADGNIGDNTTTNRSSPVSVVGGRSFSKIDAAVFYSIAIEGSTGNAYAWGLNNYGQIGDGTNTNASSPVSVLGGRSFSQIAAGPSFVVAIEGSTGNAYAWGTNATGTLGNGLATSVSSPVSVLGGRSYSKIVPGSSGVIATDGATGEIYVWGNDGALGSFGLGGSQTFVTSPVSIGRAYH